MALITIADLEVYLKSTISDGNPSISSATELQWQFIIDAVSKRIENYCNRIFASTEYTEKRDGTGTTDLQLSNYPITALTSITAVNVLDDMTDAIDTDNVEIEYDEGFLYSPYGWTKGRFNYSVVYTAGFEEIPDDLKLTTCEIVSSVQGSAGKQQGIIEEELGDYKYKLSDSIDYNTELRAGKLAHYVRID